MSSLQARTKRSWEGGRTEEKDRGALEVGSYVPPPRTAFVILLQHRALASGSGRCLCSRDLVWFVTRPFLAPFLVNLYVGKSLELASSPSSECHPVNRRAREPALCMCVCWLSIDSRAQIIHIDGHIDMEEGTARQRPTRRRERETVANFYMANC